MHRGFFDTDTLRAVVSRLCSGRRIFSRFLLPALLLIPASASAFFSTDYQQNNGPLQCQQSWPVNCNEGGGGNAACGGWNIQKNLAEAENLPGGPGYSTCSTGVRLALPDGQKTQGQPVGAMFPGKVIFAQSGKSRDGRDYGGTVVIELDLRDGSPQCFLRYMFLDRRDLPEVGHMVTSGQRIGSIASDDMSKSRTWWNDNWPGMAPQVKIDIGCDEALANLPQFMPNEPFSGGGPQDSNSCPLTKMRFPTPPLLYLVNTDDGKKGGGAGNRTCIVGASEKDARQEFTPAKKQDNSEQLLGGNPEYVPQVKPRGVIKRKKTPVYALFKETDTRENLYGANKNASAAPQLFREHKSYAAATALGCKGMTELFKGKNGSSITPAQVRRLLTHCTNQFVLGRGANTQIYEQQSSYLNSRSEAPLAEHQVERLTSEEKAQYQQALTESTSGGKVDLGKLYSKAGNIIAQTEWVDQCQPMHLEPVLAESYSVRELLHKSWQELMIEWPQENEVPPVNITPQYPNTRLNSYTQYPYERINDPVNPFSPRHIFAETERERYSNYGVQCAATPVDIILGSYPISKADRSAEHQQTYDSRDADFHSCVKCRIEVNETKEACFADPWSFSNAGGCGDFLSPSMGKELCASFDLGPHTTNPETGQPADSAAFKNYLNKLEDQNGLVRGWLHAIATQESSCRWNAVGPSTSSGQAQGMFQFMFPQSWGDRFNPWLAAKGAAERFGNTAKAKNCSLKDMVVEYNCGPACANPNNTETTNYANSISGMLGGTTNGCSSGGSATPSPNPGNVLTNLEDQEGNSSGLGYFNKDSCSEGYTGWVKNSSQSDGNCAPFSAPVPDTVTPDTTNWGCTRTWGVNGAPISPSDSMHQACVRLDADGYSNSKWCGNTLCREVNGAIKRLHMGLDHVTSVGGGGSVGKPVYAAGNGIVYKRASDGYIVEIDHSGFCMYSEDTPACSKRYAGAKGSRTVVSWYIHMGPRVLPEITEGIEVKRCQQIGTVGSMNAPETGDLHFELHDPTNDFTAGNTYASYAYPPVDPDQRYHIYPGDKSCGGGLEDRDGQYGSRGICEYKLPVNIVGKEDLTPPTYLSDENFQFPTVTMPDPPSPKRGDKFELDVPGMVYDGAWRSCTSLSGADRTTCETLNAEHNYAEPTPGPSSTEWINPAPCAPTPNEGQDFGPRILNGAPDFHGGIDLAEGEGTAILAAADGEVMEIGTSTGGCGPYVIIKHSNGKYAWYLHNWYDSSGGFNCGLQPGDQVVQGQVIGAKGYSGGNCSFGSHLHFAVSDSNVFSDSVSIDPMPLIPASIHGNPACPSIQQAQCGQIVRGLSVGGGVAGSGKRLCVKKPCSVQYDKADVISQCAWGAEEGGCGSYGDYSQRPGDCCFNITAPVPSLNMLKTRPGFNNEAKTPGWSPSNPDIRDQFIPGGWDGQRVQAEGGNVPESNSNRGAPEAYTFYEHFRDHRPYMRWWDTGAESGHLLQERALAEDDQGKYDTLVGVGVEKNNCGIGGWGNPAQLDGNTSWLELKLYQARTQNQYGMRCVGRYERLFKSKADEDYVLQLAGGVYDTFYHGSSSATSSAVNWPLGWRGYTSEPQGAYRFPYYKNIGEYDASAKVIYGLDNALPGDIIVWDEDVVGNTRLPHVAYVMQVDNRAYRTAMSAAEASEGAGDTTYRPSIQGDDRNRVFKGPRFFDKPERGEPIDSITVVEYNHGRYPDACGMTNWAGVGPERTLYKEKLPSNLVNAATNLGANTSCANPDLASCIEEKWGNVKVYRPREVVRQ